MARSTGRKRATTANREDGDYCSADCSTVTGACGDGVVQTNEACVDGNTAVDDDCSADCTAITGGCGDGTTAAGEACDDGNLVDGDYCSADCSAVTGACGADGVVQTNEACDDGNNHDGDDCSADCTRITGACADGLVQSNEVCADGNGADGDYCASDCSAITWACGDFLVQSNEACDDGNAAAGDYCAADCAATTGACGDGVLQNNDGCDDGNNQDGDLCSSDCLAGLSICGDGVLQAIEVCDEGTMRSSGLGSRPVGRSKPPSFYSARIRTSVGWASISRGVLGLGLLHLAALRIVGPLDHELPQRRAGRIVVCPGERRGLAEAHRSEEHDRVQRPPVLGNVGCLGRDDRLHLVAGEDRTAPPGRILVLLLRQLATLENARVRANELLGDSVAEHESERGVDVVDRSRRQRLSATRLGPFFRRWPLVLVAPSAVTKSRMCFGLISPIGMSRREGTMWL